MWSVPIQKSSAVTVTADRTAHDVHGI